MLYLVVRVPRSDIPVRDIKNHRCAACPLQMLNFLVGIAAAKVAAEFPQFGFWHVHPPRCTEDRRNTRRGSIRFSCFAFFPPSSFTMGNHQVHTIAVRFAAVGVPVGEVFGQEVLFHKC